jgi:Ca2+-binding EF-hand superfamily protein
MNRDNRIDKNEIKTLSIAFSNALNRNTDLLYDDNFIKTLIKELDTDRSGHISEQEFIDGLIKNR